MSLLRKVETSDFAGVIAALSFMENVARALPEEQDFFTILAHKKTLIYDIGQDVFWVIKGDDETIIENQFSMEGETLRRFMSNDENFTTLDGLRLLIGNHIKVEAANVSTGVESLAEFFGIS
jgi:hypothetical protein